MNRLIDHIPAILIAAVGVFFLWGIGYMIMSDSARVNEFRAQCIESGHQYISGNCVK